MTCPVQAVAKIQQYARARLGRTALRPQDFEAGALRSWSRRRTIAAMVADIRRWGEFGMMPALNARRHPDRAACIDDDGEFTFKELDEAAHAVANGLIEKGVKGGDGVAILARNHRWFLIADLRRRPGRRPHHPAQQRVLRPADQRGGGARGRAS